MSLLRYSDVIMSVMVSQIIGVSIVYLTVCSGADQRKQQSSASVAFVRENYRWPMGSPRNGPVTRKMLHLMTSSCLLYSIQYGSFVLCWFAVVISMSYIQANGNYTCASDCLSVSDVTLTDKSKWVDGKYRTQHSANGVHITWDVFYCE